MASFLRKGQMHTQAGKSSGKAPAQPGLDRLRFDNSRAEGVGQQAIAYENREGHDHEDAAEKQELKEWAGGVGRDKLRQECQEKNGELGVEDVEQ